MIPDIGGNSRLSRRGRALSPKGTLVIVGGEEGGTSPVASTDRSAPWLCRFVGRRLTMLASKERYTDLEALTPWLESRQVTPVMDRTYTLAEIPDAMGHLEGGRARG